MSEAMTAGEYAPSVPAMIWRLRGVSNGERLTLMFLWSKADHDVQRSPRRTEVWSPAYHREDGSRMTPTQSAIEDIRRGVHHDASDRTIRSYLKGLRDRGFIVCEGRHFELIPPDVQKSAESSQDHAGSKLPYDGKNLRDDGSDLRDAGRNLPTVGTDPPLQLNPPVPPINSPYPTHTPPAPRGSAHEGAQVSLLPDETGPPAPEAKRRSRKPPAAEDPLVREVFAHLNARIAEVAERTGAARKGGHKLTPRHGKWVRARIEDLGGGRDGVDACKRVIDVQAKDAERAGSDTEANGWLYLRPTLFNYADAFAAKLDLWREDGRHKSFGNPRAHKGDRPTSQRKSPVSNSAGRNASTAEYLERVKRGEIEPWGRIL